VLLLVWFSACGGEGKDTSPGDGLIGSTAGTSGGSTSGTSAGTSGTSAGTSGTSAGTSGTSAGTSGTSSSQCEPNPCVDVVPATCEAGALVTYSEGVCSEALGEASCTYPESGRID